MVKKSRRRKSKTRGARHTRKRKWFGGGVVTATTYFQKNIKKQYPNIVDDEYLRSMMPGFVFPPVEEVEMYNENQVETNFKSILDEIIGLTNNKDLIDFVMQLYLTGKLGEPNSMENIGRLKDNATKFNVLKQNKVDGVKKLTLTLKDFPSLSALEKFIDDKQGELQEIIEKKLKQSLRSEHQRTLKKKGEDDVEVVLETPNYIVYHPTTEAGSKFYGRETRWCTAAENDNMFCHYNQHGNLYIIQNKSNPQDKTQFHPKTMQFMNPRDKPVSAADIEILFQDEALKKWFKDTLTQTLSTLPLPEEEKKHPLFYLNYGLKHQYIKGFHINLFNAVFDMGEMPEALNYIRTEIFKNEKDDGTIAAATLRPLSQTDLKHVFKDEGFKKYFKDKYFRGPFTHALFFGLKVKDQYPEYFDDEKEMLKFLTEPGREELDFNLLSDRLQHNYIFVERLISAKYKDNNPTKYYWPAMRSLSKEDKAKVTDLRKKIEEEQCD